MFEPLRKLTLVGLGAAAMSVDKIRQVVDDLEARGEVSKEEGKKLYEDLMSRAEEERKSLNEKIRHQLREALKDLGVADRSQIGRLEKKIEALEKRLDAIAPAQAKTEGSSEIPTTD